VIRSEPRWTRLLSSSRELGLKASAARALGVVVSTRSDMDVDVSGEL
jgi:hypothetical protein